MSSFLEAKMNEWKNAKKLTCGSPVDRGDDLLGRSRIRRGHNRRWSRGRSENARSDYERGPHTYPPLEDGIWRTVEVLRRRCWFRLRCLHRRKRGLMRWDDRLSLCLQHKNTMILVLNEDLTLCSNRAYIGLGAKLDALVRGSTGAEPDRAKQGIRS